MYEVFISIMSTEGDDLSYETVCNEEELKQLLRTYDVNEISYRKID